ncbi:hypothetical protein SPONN_425 [uncultured Candidatus Thioglobus sp.]|nr:hypothetical protein SPONN_425 [uncultured Candidatus Thioglobus sp.]
MVTNIHSNTQEELLPEAATVAKRRKTLEECASVTGQTEIDAMQSPAAVASHIAPLSPPIGPPSPHCYNVLPYENRSPDCSGPPSPVNPLVPTLSPSTSVNAACNVDADIEQCNDIGLLLRSKPQIYIRNLSSKLKYSLLTNHFKPGYNFRFPSRFIGGCNRACQHSYLIENPWFVYSKAEDGLFCLPCVLFAAGNEFGQFVCEKFNFWPKKSLKFKSHNCKEYHKLAMSRAEALMSAHTMPETSIQSLIHKVSSEDIARNRYIVKCMADTILFCGKQCIALRGHRDDSTADEHSNKGTFLALLDYSVRSGNIMLDNHLKESARNALYTSKTTQNQLIECIGGHIRDKILYEVREAKWFSVLCDEVSDVSSKEQLSIVLRFVDSNRDIREEFVDFVSVERITGEVLAAKIKETLVKYDLDFQNCRGQGYDGASNMSGANGVQGRLVAENSKALYFHCKSHILNLCIVQACGLQSIRNMNSTVTEAAYFFHNSSKRQHFLELVVCKQTTTVKVKDLCRTRWVYRHEAYESFGVLFKYLVKTMKAIVQRDSSYEVMNWDSKTVVAANGLLSMFTDFNFVISFVATMNAMAIIKPISIKLQKRSNDIVNAYHEVTAVISELVAVRGDDKVLHAWYMQAQSFAADVDVVPEVPRTTTHQRNRANVDHTTAEEYYRRSVVIPLLDNLIVQMQERFGSSQTVASKLLDIVPSVMCNTESTFDDLVAFYEDDLPNSSLIETELWRWKAKWERQNAADRPSSLEIALNNCDQDYFPNIHALLHIGCTLPVTSCENERANSALKNLKTFLRSTMGEERLSALALMHVHHRVPVDLENVVDRFKIQCNRRIIL